jgi:hypothetical protein
MGYGLCSIPTTRADSTEQEGAQSSEQTGAQSNTQRGTRTSSHERNTHEFSYEQTHTEARNKRSAVRHSSMFGIQLR